MKTDEEAKEIVEKVVKFYSSELFSKLKIKSIEFQIIDRHPSDLSNDPFLISHRFNKNVSLTMGMRVDVTKFNTFSSDFQEQSLIRLYYGAMRQMSENSKFLITFKALLTLAHEIYHIYQKETNKEVFNDYISSSTNYTNYKNQTVEVEARRFARRYTWKNIFKILKMI